MNGGLEIGFDACPRSGRTRLAHLHQQAPLRALFPLCTGMDLPVAVATSTSGGFAGGDRMDIALRSASRPRPSEPPRRRRNSIARPARIPR